MTTLTTRNICKHAFRSFVTALPPSLGQSIYFLRYHGRWPNLRTPRSLSEKIVRRKIIDPPHSFVDYADKVKAKQLVSQKLGSDFVNPTLWSGTSLPDVGVLRSFIPFVLKANFGNDKTLFVCSEKDLNYGALRRKVNTWLAGAAQDPVFYERWYELIERKLLIESHLTEGGEAPADYKVFCFHGKPLFIQVDSQRFSDHRRDFYDSNWNILTDLSVTYPTSGALTPKPLQFNKMMTSAAVLSADFEFVRVDFYCLPALKFGEFTFAPGSGFERFTPYRYDLLWGKYW